MKKKTKLWLVLLICVLTLAAELFWVLSLMGKGAQSTFPAVKDNEHITWEYYQTMTYEEQDKFQEQFDSKEAFENWMVSAKPDESIPDNFVWDKPGKQPDAYTWEEYQALSAFEQEAFYHWFSSADAFEAWMNQVRPEGTISTVPEWKPAEKKPNEYTWEEYQKLSPEEKESFFLWFESVEAFEAWMHAVKPEEEETSPVWNKPGKKPNEYTWEEYLALTYEEQGAFFQWFESEKAFEAWMDSVKPKEDNADNSWNKPGKLPNEYTWEEYLALTPEEQDAFFQWFESVETFEAWMESVKPKEETSSESWNKPGKLPNEYTWEEYLALTPQEQDLFFQWFESVEAFEAWMYAAKGEEAP